MNGEPAAAEATETIDCPFSGSDSLPGCQRGAPADVMAHVRDDHLRPAGFTPQSFLSSMGMKVSTLKGAAKILRAEGDADVLNRVAGAEAAERLALRMHSIHVAVAAALQAEAREKIGARYR